MVFWVRRVRCGKVEETNDALTKLRRLKHVVMAPDTLQIWMQKLEDLKHDEISALSGPFCGTKLDS